MTETTGDSDDEDDTITVSGVLDQRRQTWISVTRRNKTAYTKKHNFLLGISVAITELAEQDVHLTLPRQQQIVRQQVDRVHNPTKEILVAERPGWVTRDAYALPSGTVISKGVKRASGVVVAFARQSGSFVRGTLAQWQASVGAALQYQPILQAIACFALMGVLLRHFGRLAGIQDNPMINIVGQSSCGKTTALRVANSLFGVGPLGSWLATINAMEDLGQASNDGSLFLDEGFHAGADNRTRALTQSAVVMALSSGMVKARKGQVSPPAAKFSAISTSNGYVASYGGNTAAVDPALMVRMPVIDLVGRLYGILDRPGPDGATRLIDRINAATSMYGGAPVSAFLIGLTGALATDRAKLNEPPRVRRRLFGLSQAAMGS